MSKFLLLLGPSGVGKSTIIGLLKRISDKFVYIKPYMTRPLRHDEIEKVAVSNERMDELEKAGELLVVNTLFGGIRYGTPRSPIVQALQTGDYPILDWPIKRLHIMREAFPDNLFTVYVSPPSLEILQQRLAEDGRDPTGVRFAEAQEELQEFWNGDYAKEHDLSVVSKDGDLGSIAAEIFQRYLLSF